MYSTCIFCHHPLGSNPLIESCPIGQRLAFDPAKGRLWVVCRNCERWNLTPFEERWEALEDCERRFRGTRLRFSTSNIGLARLDPGLDLVRIGAPLRPELAAWRYGDQFGRRRRRHLVTTGVLLVTVPAALISVNLGLAAIGVSAAGLLIQGAVGVRNAVRKHRTLGGVDVGKGKQARLTREILDGIELKPAALEPGWFLQIPANKAFDMPHTLSGDAAVSALQRIIPLINYQGGNGRVVQDAVRRLEAVPEVSEQLRNMAVKPRPAYFGGYEYQLRHHSPDKRMALEMLLREDLEERSMTGELHLLEREWRAAEEVAGIADGLLLDPGISGKLDSMHRDGASTDHQS